MNAYFLECLHKIFPEKAILSYGAVCQTPASIPHAFFMKRLENLILAINPARLDAEPGPEQLKIFTAWVREYGSSSANGRARSLQRGLFDRLRLLDIHVAYADAVANDFTGAEKELHGRWCSQVNAELEANGTAMSRCPGCDWARFQHFEHFLGTLEDLYVASGVRDLSRCGKIDIHKAAIFCLIRVSKKWTTKVHQPKACLLLLTGFEYSTAELMEYSATLGASVQKFQELRLPACMSTNAFLMLRRCLEGDPWLAHSHTDDVLKQRFEEFDLDAACRDMRLSNHGHKFTMALLFRLLGAILSNQGFNDRHDALRKVLPVRCTGGNEFERLLQLSQWHAEMLPRILEAMLGPSRSSYKSERRKLVQTSVSQCALYIARYASEKHGDAIRCDMEPFRWFVENCTKDMLHAMVTSFVAATVHRPDMVKSANDGHSCQTRALRMLRFVKCGLDGLVPRGHCNSLTRAKLLRAVENQREPADPMTRRTFTASEIEAMVAACKGDSKLILLMVLLSEVGLRQSAIRHLRLRDVADDRGEPRHICAVKEKCNARRCFVTSDKLKECIKNHATVISAAAEDAGRSPAEVYLMSCPGATRSDAPVTSATIGQWLKKLAKSAGVTDVVVHPHAFRHTIVGNLMDAGNSLEVVSKFMGHKSLDTTSSHYWVANVQELHENMNNPLTGNVQEGERVDELKDMELAVLRAKKAKALDIIFKVVEVLGEEKAAGGSAEKAAQRIKESLPNLAELVRAICEDEK